MLIGIDASQAAKQKKTGIEYLSSQLILNLKEIDHTNSYLLFTNVGLNSQYLSSNFKEIHIPLKRLWQTFRLPLSLLKHKPDIFIEIGYRLPSFAPKKSICFVHDLASKYFPGSYSSIQKILLNSYYAKARSAKTLIFISQNSQKDYNKYFPGYNGKQNVIYPGYDRKLYKKISKPKNVLKLASKYLLYLGRIEKRKNIYNLIMAYEIFCQKNGYDYRLVLAGQKGYGFDEIKETIRLLDPKINSNIILPGYVAEKDLPHLYAGAELFVFPSLYEGFGLPILEAMACGTAVICSNTSSLPESAGNAAHYFNPKKPTGIAKSIEKVLFDQKFQSQLIEKGFRQSDKFSYKKMAEQVLGIISKL